METPSKSRLAARKRAYRLWFEYLKVARSKPKKEVKSALLVSKPFYAPWELDDAADFNLWWPDHWHLFEETYSVRELQPGEPPHDPNALLIEVPLTKSATILAKKVKELIQDAYARQAKTQRKGKTKPTAYYHLTEGAEPKFNAIREMLFIYRDVYLKNRTLRGSDLLEAAHRYYLGRPNKRWAKIPIQFQHDGTPIDKIRAMRNLRRYIQKAEKVVLNVARGEFPGRY
jgi:hypothetical protein